MFLAKFHIIWPSGFRGKAVLEIKQSKKYSELGSIIDKCNITPKALVSSVVVITGCNVFYIIRDILLIVFIVIINYEQIVSTVMVKNSTNINKMNYYLSFCFEET
jgi:hypothetical protein